MQLPMAAVGWRLLTASPAFGFHFDAISNCGFNIVPTSRILITLLNRIAFFFYVSVKCFFFVFFWEFLMRMPCLPGGYIVNAMMLLVFQFRITLDECKKSK